MLKGLFRGWVSSVINEKANKDLRDAQIRDKPQKAQPFLLLPPVTSVTRESETRAVGPILASGAQYCLLHYHVRSRAVETQ